MQRRLTIALVGVALASVLLVGAGVLILAQVGAREQTTEEAINRVDVLVELAALDADSRRRRPQGSAILQRAFPLFQIDEAQLVVIEPDGTTSVIERFSAPNRRGAEEDLTTIATLDDDQLATLADGEAIVLADDGRTVTVLQTVEPLTTGPFAGTTLAVTAKQPVVTVGRDARLWFLISAAAVLVGALGASALLARRFAKPLRDIERATAAVAAGDFTTRVDVDGEDELAQLGRSVNEMAGELERSKALDQQFLMSVSHDLRTPLTAIAGYAEALSDGAATDPRQTGEIIRNHAGRLERLVGDLLDLARLDANRFRLDLQPVDVAVIVGRTVAGLTPRAEQHGLQCTFHHDGSVVASVDADRLGQAVGNLVDNAIKFASSTIDVRVGTHGTDASITVTDDGPGIGADDLPHVFERLYVSRHQPARAENPSGMGLAIVRELATAMGGSVAAGPGPTAGTTMTLRFPLLPVATPEPSPPGQQG